MPLDNIIQAFDLTFDLGQVPGPAAGRVCSAETIVGQLAEDNPSGKDDVFRSDRGGQVFESNRKHRLMLLRRLLIPLCDGRKTEQVPVAQKVCVSDLAGRHNVQKSRNIVRGFAHVTHSVAVMTAFVSTCVDCRVKASVQADLIGMTPAVLIRPCVDLIAKTAARPAGEFCTCQDLEFYRRDNGPR